MSNIIGEQSGNPKICNFDREIVVKENVVGLHISMNDIGSMEENQCTSCFYSNPHSNRPGKRARTGLITTEMISNSPVRNVFIDKEELTAAA